MVSLVERDLHLEVEGAIGAWKADDQQNHPLSHCMKSVDFIIEWQERYWFVEFKDPQHPEVEEGKRQEFLERFLRQCLDEDLKYKYRDSFLYEWAAGRVRKPVLYLVLIAADTLETPLLQTRSDELRRKLPVHGQGAGEWRHPIAEDCLVFNIQEWNRYMGPCAQVSRLSE